MKLKVSLQRAGGEAQDLLVTADASTTVGELAHRLRISDPHARQLQGLEDAEASLSLVGEGNRVLDPRMPLAESPIKSGATIGLARRGVQFETNQGGAIAVASVLSGPDAGREFPLRSGTNMVGRQRGCEVRLDDPMVSRTHARVNITDHIEVIDLGSANGVELNGSLVSREVVRSSDRVNIGGTTLSFRFTQVASAEGRTDSASVGFIRSPRLAPVYPGRNFEAPEAPQRSQKQPFPVMMLVLPILMAGVLYLVTKQATTLLFAGLSPLMMIASWWENRRHMRQVDKAALEGFRSDLRGLVGELQQEQVTEVTGRLHEHPSAIECATAARDRRPLLWTRRPDDWGFLELRLGLGTQPTRSTIKPVDGKNSPRELVVEGRTALEPFHWVAGVPVIASPVTAGGLGVAGPRSAAIGAARALVLQAAALHSPAELVIALLGSQRYADDWSWLRWLPHVDAPWSPVEARHLAASPGDANALITALEAVVGDRDDEGREGVRLPAVLVVVESDTATDFGRLSELCEKGWRRGVFVLWVAPDTEQLPAGCRTFIDTKNLTHSGVGYVHDARAVMPVLTETVSADLAAAFARSIAPVIDLGARHEDSSDLPRSISFLAMEGYGGLGDQPDAVIERWNQNHSILTGPCASEPRKKAASLRAAVGHSAGHLHQLDLRTDGPHALVGGTTGAGKSELLQAWILSMAANHSPQRLTFLLVDYKGGSAFAECDRLPHTVGMVTNLDANGVQRALLSLSAELDHRMRLLQRAKAKDLMELEKRWDITAPPSLVIVIDEFAALVQEVPEFVDGVVNVAQRGRSLGVHLILATQRPAGVIKDNLRANTNLRLALRVADEADSSDVLGVPDAAFFDPDLPGRAVSKTGASRLAPFQTAYAGGQTGSGPTAPDITIEELVFGHGAQWEIPEGLLPPVPETDGPTDIARVVATVQQAAAAAELPAPRRPWLDDLQPSYNVIDIVKNQTLGDRLVFGVVDAPSEQQQFPVSFDPDRSGNLAVFGSSGAGKSTMLRTLAVTAGLGTRGGPTWVYGLDFGAQGLAMLDGLPHVGAIVRGNDDERVRRTLTWLQGVTEERAARYVAVNAGTVAEYRRSSGRTDEPRILLLVDNLAGFLKTYESNDVWIDRLIGIAAQGRAVGVHVVVTADRSGAVPTQLAATIQQRLVMRMTSVDDYDNLGAPRFMLSTNSVAGRGIWEGREVQVAVLGKAPEPGKAPDLGVQDREMKSVARVMREAGVPAAIRIERLSDHIELSALPVARGQDLVVGVVDETREPLTIAAEGTFVVAGPPAAGRTTALATIAAAFRRRYPEGASYLFTLDRRSRLLTAPGWTAQALGTEDGSALADRLASEFASKMRTPTLVVVEKVVDWGDGMAEFAVDSMLKAATAAGALVVVDGEASTFGRTFGIAGTVNASKAGFLLQPESGDAAAFGAKLPNRLNRADFPPGRGFVVRSGRISLSQLAI